MLSIKKITDKKIITELNDRYNLVTESDRLYLGAVSNNQIIEFIQYELCDDTLYVDYISNISGDFSVIYGLIKSLLFACDINIIKKIVLPNEYSLLAESLGFEKKPDSYVLLLENYSNKSCGDGKE